MGRRPHRGRDCTPALCCMAFGLGVLLALCGEGRTALITLLQKAKDGVNGATGTRIIKK